MAENTKIEWADDTFNPWVGCRKVEGSRACDHCYAADWAKRAGRPQLWEGTRERTKPANWAKPLKWNSEAAAAGVRRRVFCASLADVFDDEVPPDWRADLWALIANTPALDWLLLTKRPQNILGMLPPDWGTAGYSNVWLCTTVEDQQHADERIPSLLSVPARVHFLSCEPLMGPVDLLRTPRAGQSWDWLTGEHESAHGRNHTHHLDWVIAGGESGPGARPSHPDWFRTLRDQCATAGVPFFFKQWGNFCPVGQQVAGGGLLENRFQGGGPDGEWGWHTFEDGTDTLRIGKKAAGRLLDGIEHNGMPE